MTWCFYFFFRVFARGCEGFGEVIERCLFCKGHREAAAFVYVCMELCTAPKAEVGMAAWGC
jgi:hypothetical protein